MRPVLVGKVCKGILPRFEKKDVLQSANIILGAKVGTNILRRN